MKSQPKPKPMASKKKISEPKRIESKKPKMIDSAPREKAKMQMKSDAMRLGTNPNDRQKEKSLVEKFSKPAMEQAFKKNPISLESRYFKKKENVMREMVDKKPKQTLVQKVASKVTKRK